MNPATSIQAMPKVDLHRRFTGSLRYETLLEMAREQGVDIDIGSDVQRERVEGTRPSPPRALYSLEAVTKLLRSETLVHRAAREIVGDALDDNLKHVELHLTTSMLSGKGGLPASQVVDGVLEAIQGTPEEGMKAGLTLGLSRAEPVAQAERIVQIAADRLGKGVLGVHLGDDEGGSLRPFEALLRQARAEGLGISVEAGSRGDSEGVLHAIEHLFVERILQGTSVMNDPAIVRSALDHNVIVGVCLSSELAIGVDEPLRNHAFPDMLQAGLHLTLNTLDPGRTESSLSGEYMLASDRFGISLETLKGIVLSSAQAAFLPERARKVLEQDLVRELFASKDGDDAVR